jgi:hypothetical protein
MQAFLHGHIRSSCQLLLAISALIAHAAAAQGVETPSRGQSAKRCQQAVEQASSATSSAGRRTAFGELRQGRCRAVVVSGLSRAWRSVRIEDVDFLRETTAQVGDRRMADSLEAVATDSRIPTLTRLNALAALVTYADPSAFAEFSSQTDPEKVMIGTYSHPMQQPGEVPLRETDREGVLKRMDRIAERTTDPQVRAAAKALRRQLLVRRSAKQRLRAG